MRTLSDKAPNITLSDQTENFLDEALRYQYQSNEATTQDVTAAVAANNDQRNNDILAAAFAETRAPDDTLEQESTSNFTITATNVIRLAGNWSRDFVWPITTAAQVAGFPWQPPSPSDDPTSVFWKQTGVQTAYSALAAILTQAAFFYALTKNGYEIDTKAMLVGTAALILAIPSWNYGAAMFANIGSNNLNMTDVNAGYFGSIGAGVGEGPLVQFFLYEMLLLMACHKDTLKRYADYLGSCAGLLGGMAYYGFNLPIAPLAGAVWQLIYNSIFPNCPNTPSDCATPTPGRLIGVGFAVATCVFVMNYLSMVSVNVYDKKCGAKAEANSEAVEDTPALQVIEMAPVVRPG